MRGLSILHDEKMFFNNPQYYDYFQNGRHIKKLGLLESMEEQPHIQFAFAFSENEFLGSVDKAGPHKLGIVTENYIIAHVTVDLGLRHAWINALNSMWRRV